MTESTLSGALAANGEPIERESMADRMMPMDTFKWIVSGLLGALLLCAGWFLSEIRSDVRDLRKEITAVRVEAAATSTKLDSLLDDWRRRPLR